MKQFLANEQATIDFGQRVAQMLEPGAIVYLHGDLGAGKTTMVRSILQSISPGQRVKSPSYAIVEPYHIDHIDYYHLDLYRINDPRALYDLGLDEIFQVNTICFIEWPEHGLNVLPPATINIYLSVKDLGRACEVVRCKD